MNEPLISIIIPCFNHGAYIQEAIDSVKSWLEKDNAEVIIINDGSTDEYTVEKLLQLQKDGWNIIHQENMGLAAARNNAIKRAKGKYIIPLDSDNKLTENYLTKAIPLLETNSMIGIIYGNAQKFGMIEKTFKPGKFDIQTLLLGNYIDACAIFRIDIWKKIKGYDEKMLSGSEDWEFWISAYLEGYHFHYLDELCYYYRVLPNSMTFTYIGSSEKFTTNWGYVINKHRDKIRSLFISLKKDNEKKSYILNYLKSNKVKGSIKVLFGFKNLYL